MKTLVIIIGLFLLMSSSILKAQTAPVASDVAVLGEALYNSTPDPDQATILTGFYTFSDADGDAEGVSTYKWYRDLDGDGPEPSEVIAGAISLRYTVQLGDVLNTIYFEVTPVDDEPLSGTAVASATGTTASSTTYTDFDSNNSVTISSDTQWLNADIKQNKTLTVNKDKTLEIFGDFYLVAGGIIINVSEGATLIIYGKLTTENNLKINIDSADVGTTDGSLIIKSGLIANNNTDITIEGTMEIEGDVNVVQNATFTIEDGGSLEVTGDLIAGDNAVLNIEGDVSIIGDLTVGANADIIVDLTLPVGGTLSITGDLTGGNNTEILGSGNVTVGGTVDPPSLATDSQLLPVELVSFKTSLFRDRVILHWITASEENNDYFTIERSTDGVSFKEIKRVSGAGYSTEKRNYSHIDEKPAFGVNYYRLKQTDFNGQFSYSDINTVTNLSASQFEIGPNPATNYIQISSPSELSGTIKILSSTGGKVLETSVSGQNETIDISFIQPGQYLVIFDTGKGLITKKLRVQ
ncbi:MAG: T9SS type A sorting domain-containing protein [Salinivirgaceae bacterium]|nr:T9SS type A sorting domain-containing protein [Salinivirgaceae bacterium]